MSRATTFLLSGPSMTFGTTLGLPALMACSYPTILRVERQGRFRLKKNYVYRNECVTAGGKLLRY